MQLLPLISLPPPEGMEGETGLGNCTPRQGQGTEGSFSGWVGGRGFDLNTKKHLEPNQQQIVVPS